EMDTVAGAGTGSFSFDGGIINYTNVSDVDDLAHAKSATYKFTGTSILGNPPTVHVMNGPHLIDYGVYDIYAGSLQQTFPFIIGTGGDGVPATVPINFAYKTNLTVQGGAKNSSFTVDNTMPAEGLGAMTIDPGKGASTVTIAGTCVATTVTNSGVAKDVA